MQWVQASPQTGRLSFMLMLASGQDAARKAKQAPAEANACSITISKQIGKDLIESE